MKHQPIGSRILIKLDNSSEKMQNGIHIPESQTSITQSGCVIEIGTGYIGDNNVRIPITSVAVGNRVWIAKYAFNRSLEEVEHNGMKCVVISENDILSIITE